VAWVFLKASGWRIVGAAPDPSDTCIFVCAPHTSGFDSALLLAVAWQNDLRIKFLIKSEIVEGPFGFFWRAVGAIPVERDNPGPLVDQLIELAKGDRGFQLALTPEGTRKPVEYWKSGFYRLARASGVQVQLCAPDGPTKVVTMGPMFHLSGDVSADMDRLRAFFEDKAGVDPSKATRAQMRAESDPVAAEELANIEPRSA